MSRQFIVSGRIFGDVPPELIVHFVTNSYRLPAAASSKVGTSFPTSLSIISMRPASAGTSPFPVRTSMKTPTRKAGPYSTGYTTR